VKKLLARALVIAGIITAVAVTGAGGTWLYLKYAYSPRRWPREPFSSERWKSLPQHERYRLCNDLLRSGQLRDIPRSKVVELLGTPDRESAEILDYIVKDLNSTEPRVVALYYLEMQLDENGIVRGAFIRSD